MPNLKIFWIPSDVFIIQWKHPVIRCVPEKYGTKRKKDGGQRKKYGAQRKKYGAQSKYRQKRQAADEPNDSAVKVDDIELENSDKDNLKLSFKIALNLTGLENFEKEKREVGNKKGFRTLSYDDYEGKILVINGLFFIFSLFWLVNKRLFLWQKTIKFQILFSSHYQINYKPFFRPIYSTCK